MTARLFGRGRPLRGRWRVAISTLHRRQRRLPQAHFLGRPR